MKYIGLFLGVIVVIWGVYFGYQKFSDTNFNKQDVFVAEDDNFKRGMNYKMEGRLEEAKESFYKVISAYGDKAPEAHLQLGYICEQNPSYCFDALYHFRQYLRILGNALTPDQAKKINGRMIIAQKELLKTLPGQPYEPASDSLSSEVEKKYKDLFLENDVLKRKLVELNAKIARLEADLNIQQPPPVVGEEVQLSRQSPVVAIDPPKPPIQEAPSIPKTHRVEKGETLSSISKKYYKTSAKWRRIFANNRDVLDSPGDLRVGQILKLPKE